MFSVCCQSNIASHIENVSETEQEEGLAECTTATKRTGYGFYWWCSRGRNLKAAFYVGNVPSQSLRPTICVESFEPLCVILIISLPSLKALSFASSKIIQGPIHCISKNLDLGLQKWRCFSRNMYVSARSSSWQFLGVYKSSHARI